MKGNPIGIVLGLAILSLLLWVFKAGDPGSMQVMGMALANPETQREKALVDNIGVHSIIGNGAHSHGAMSLADQKAEKDGHLKAERDIFVKPDGLYTMADIARNGPLPSSQKFYDVMSRHDLKVHKGERICPITETRANESLYWWIGGKRYTFCWPPCIEEFVRKGEERPRGVRGAMKAARNHRQGRTTPSTGRPDAQSAFRPRDPSRSTFWLSPGRASNGSSVQACAPGAGR